MLSAARIDLAAFFVHLVAANVFGAHATCNRCAGWLDRASSLLSSLATRQ